MSWACNAAASALPACAKLKSYGFNMVVGTDCTVKEMEKRAKAFRKLLEAHKVGLFLRRAWRADRGTQLPLPALP
jgi:hypothetical protein